MILGFKRQFAPFVWNGTKTHSIRSPRSGGPAIRVGQRLDCYVDPRQKSMALLGRFECIEIQSIVISEFFNREIPLAMSIDRQLLSTDESEALMWRDGFRDPAPGVRCPAMQQAAKFWQERLAGGAYWKGLLIHWRYDAATATPAAKLPRWLQKQLSASGVQSG